MYAVQQNPYSKEDPPDGIRQPFLRLAVVTQRRRTLSCELCAREGAESSIARGWGVGRAKVRRWVLGGLLVELARLACFHALAGCAQYGLV